MIVLCTYVHVQLLAVWVLADWKSRGETTPIQLVELGPGRGTLLKDMLRVGTIWRSSVCINEVLSGI